MPVLLSPHLSFLAFITHLVSVATFGTSQYWKYLLNSEFTKVQAWVICVPLKINKWDWPHPGLWCLVFMTAALKPAAQGKFSPWWETWETAHVPPWPGQPSSAEVRGAKKVYFLIKSLHIFMVFSFSVSTGYRAIFEDVRCGEVANFFAVFRGGTASDPSGLRLWQCWQWGVIHHSEWWGNYSNEVKCSHPYF